jgi:hypothetical protein
MTFETYSTRHVILSTLSPDKRTSNSTTASISHMWLFINYRWLWITVNLDQAKLSCLHVAEFNNGLKWIPVTSISKALLVYEQDTLSHILHILC